MSSPENASPRTYLETYAALIRDRRIGHGAFRLWHALRDYTDHASKCFPGQRRLADDIGCDPHRLKIWTAQLVAANWLRVEGGNGRRFDYTVLNGNGQPLRKPATPTVAQTCNGGVAETNNGGVAETNNGGVAETNNGGVAETNNGGVAETNNGGVAETCNEPLRKPATKVSSPINQAHLSKSKCTFPEDSGIPD